jgi:hypothetical protein
MLKPIKSARSPSHSRGQFPWHVAGFSQKCDGPLPIPTLRGRIKSLRGTGAACGESGIIERHHRVLELVIPGLRLTMPCLLLLAVTLFPRIALAVIWFTSTYLQRAFHQQLLLPIVGFIFLPLTTLVYAWEINSGMPTVGINLLWLLLAVIIDLGGLGGGAHRQSRR